MRPALGVRCGAVLDVKQERSRHRFWAMTELCLRIQMPPRSGEAGRQRVVHSGSSWNRESVQFELRNRDVAPSRNRHQAKLPLGRNRGFEGSNYQAANLPCVGKSIKNGVPKGESRSSCANCSNPLVELASPMRCFRRGSQSFIGRSTLPSCTYATDSARFGEGFQAT